jgi:FkbM family methyltransferase
MAEYKRNKIRTAWQIIRDIENWPTAFGMRLRQQHRGLRLLNFRNGLNITCRGGTRDWDVVHELYFTGSYGRAMNFLKDLPGEPLVLDLGGNIGLFSLRAALARPAARIYAYEPGPPNYQIFEMNCLANPVLAKGLHLRKEAVAGQTRIAEWLFDEENPGGSTLFGNSGVKYQVQIRAFADVLKSLTGDVALAKIDIEGAEYEVLEATPPELWKRIQAISLELHDDPAGRMSQADFMKRMGGLGFKAEQETVCSFFLHR